MKVTIYIERKADFETVIQDMNPSEFALLQNHDRESEIDFRGTTIQLHRVGLEMVEGENGIALEGRIFAAMTYSEYTNAASDERFLEGRTEVLQQREAEERKYAPHLKAV